MKSSIRIILLAFTLAFHDVNGQTAIDYAMNYLETTGHTENWNDPWALRQTFENYIKSPVNLNHADFDELMGLPLFQNSQVINLMYFRSRGGRIMEFQELRFIEGFDSNFIALIQPFCSLEAGQQLPDLRRDWKNRSPQFDFHTSMKMPFNEGIIHQDFIGPPLGYQGRLKIDLGLSGSLGFRFQSDIGERPFDFNSISLCLNFTGLVKKIVLGDFSIRSALGLVLGQGALQSTLGIIRNNESLKGYFSGDENNFSRGIAIHYGSKQWSAISFLSRRNMDVSLKENNWSTLQTSGYHRTENELKNRGLLDLMEIGQSLLYQGQKVHLGANFTTSTWNIPQMDHWLSTSRTERFDYSIFAKFKFQKSNLNLEIKPQSELGYSFNLETVLKDGFDFTLFSAKVPDDLPRMAQPEVLRSSGLLHGFRFHQQNRVEWSILYQVKKSDQRELLREISAHLLRVDASTKINSAEVYARISKNYLPSNNVLSARIQITWQHHSNLIFRSRLERSLSSTSPSDLLFNELKYSFNHASLTFRHTMTAINDSPIYSIEPSTPFESGLASYYFSGNKINLLFHLKRWSQHVWISVGFAERLDGKTFGSGSDATNSSTLWEAHAQYRITW